MDFIDAYLTEMEKTIDISDPNFQQGLIDDYKKFREIVDNYLQSLRDAGG